MIQERPQASRNLQGSLYTLLRSRMPWRLALICLLAVWAGGCAVSVRSAGPRPTAQAAVRIPDGHAHSRKCGHVHDGRRWVVVRGHVHGRGCGHSYRGGRWVVVRKR